MKEKTRHLRLRNHGTTRQFFWPTLVWLLAAGLGWTSPALSSAGSGSPAGSVVGWVVGDRSGGYGVILRTTDGGIHWQRQGTPEEIPNVGLLGVSAVNQECVWAVGGNTGGYGVILHTTDGGAHWLRQGTPAEIPDVGLCDVYAVNQNIAWATGAQGVILHTTKAAA